MEQKKKIKFIGITIVTIIFLLISLIFLTLFNKEESKLDYCKLHGYDGYKGTGIPLDDDFICCKNVKLNDRIGYEQECSGKILYDKLKGS